MSSRNSSAASLPVLITNDSIDLLNNQSTPRKRQVHLKSTLRKDKSHQEREKHHHHSGPVSITESERKRYEGLWAANHPRDVFSLSIDKSLDNFIIRQLWIRSNLPPEILRHIWYPHFKFTNILGILLIVAKKAS
jgi:hypothetical protein